MDVQNEMLMAKRTKEMLNPDQLPDQDQSHIKNVPKSLFVGPP